uniref:Uncharacterized protein n=1 Tax=Sinocyclocheilus anshuiensis TaxID=1608454 RepID=A0A671JZR5_9TELE
VFYSCPVLYCKVESCRMTYLDFCPVSQLPAASSALSSGRLESSLSDCSFSGWTVTDCTHKEDAGESARLIRKNISSSRQFSVGNSLDGCDFSINVRDLSEEAELVFCVHCLILMIHPELNIRNESRKLSVDLVFIFGLKKLMEDVSRIFSSLIPEDNTFQTQCGAASLSHDGCSAAALRPLTDLLRGFQFNTLLFSKIRNQMDDMSNEYQPRIYTGDEWRVFINVFTFKYPNHGQNNGTQSFSIPAHTSALYREQKLQWKAQVFLIDQKCSNSGVSCQNRYEQHLKFNVKIINLIYNQFKVLCYSQPEAMQL